MPAESDNLIPRGGFPSRFSQHSYLSAVIDRVYLMVFIPGAWYTFLRP